MLIFGIITNVNRGNMSNANPRRMTQQRRAILDAVARLGCHPTADQVFEMVRREMPKVSLSTVYRNLGILAEQGDILPVRGCGDEVHYDHNTHEHHHGICRICGRMIDLPADTVKASAMSDEWRERDGFEAEEIVVTVTGVCSGCLNATQKG